MNPPRNKLSEKKIIKQHHDQIVFDLKRAFLQSVTLLLINKSPKYNYEIKAEILRLTKGGFDIDRNNLYKRLRTLEKDGYNAYQLAYDDKKEKNTSNPLKGHFKKAGVAPKRILHEFKNFAREIHRIF